jgi:PadR family transcriptional regulator, regulatory protein PadR
MSSPLQIFFTTVVGEYSAKHDLPMPRPFDILMRPVASSTRVPNESKAGVLQGTLDLMILQTLGPLHGDAVAARIEQVSGGAIQLNMETLYPSLLRLEQGGFVRARWDKSENNRRARFYSITAAGRRRLDAEKAEWTRTTGIMEPLLSEEAL